MLQGAAAARPGKGDKEPPGTPDGDSPQGYGGPCGGTLQHARTPQKQKGRPGWTGTPPKPRLPYAL